MTRGSWFGSARGADGFTMIELLVASAIAIATTSAMIQLTRGAQGAFVAMNDLVDVQQKMRVAADAIQHDLAMAGAGSALPDGGGALARYLPAIRPAAGVSGAAELQARLSQGARVAHSDTYVVARLTLEELVTAALPLTAWWNEKILGEGAHTARTHSSQAGSQVERTSSSLRKSGG